MKSKTPGQALTDNNNADDPNNTEAKAVNIEICTKFFLLSAVFIFCWGENTFLTGFNISKQFEMIFYK